MDNDILNEVNRCLYSCKERIRISKENESKYKEHTTKLKQLEDALLLTKETVNHTTKMYKNILYFLENKKIQSKDILEEAIRSTSRIVKDSDLYDCSIEHENGKTRILNSKGQNINGREGSAARGIMGFIIRYSCVKAMPNKIQILFLDESFCTLSDDTILNFVDIINKLSKNITIVGIEQRNLLFSGIQTKVYEVNKVDKVSTVREIIQ